MICVLVCLVGGFRCQDGFSSKGGVDEGRESKERGIEMVQSGLLCGGCFLVGSV